MAKIFLSLYVPGYDPRTGPFDGPRCVEYTCPQDGRQHERIWVIDRVLADTMGHFPVFRIGGEMAVVDGSLPHKVRELPRDARELSPVEMSRLWHGDGSSHVFGA